MQQKQLFGPVKILSYIVLSGMAAAIIYAFSIAVRYWSGIGV